MAKRKTMTDSELAASLDEQIADAVAYEQSDLSKYRDRALAYYEGRMDDVPAEVGRSSVVSHDVADVIGWIMPSLLRVFLATDRVVEYQPTRRDDERFAAQATEYINYIFLRDCEGFKKLRAACHDGLLLGNGILKHWWHEEDCHEFQRMTGLSGDLFALIAQDATLQVVEHTESLDPYTGEPVHDVRLRKSYKKAQVRLEAVPPEEFLIERSATALDEDVRFCAHVRTQTRSELIKEGYDRKAIEGLPEHSVREKAKYERDDRRQWAETTAVDDSVERVRIYECYVLIDYDGDGIAERRKVVVSEGAGQNEERRILENEEWPDMLPFTDIVPDPTPHRWRGRSMFDEVEDVQRIKTVLMRQTLDNLYWVNNPQRAVVANQIENMDELLTPTFGGVVIEKTQNAIRDLPVPFVAANSFQVLEYLDAVVEKRTGVSRATMALDPEALQNQTATAVNEQRSAAQSKVELYARNIAETGLARLFRCLLRLVVRHQDKARTIRLRDEWVDMDPRPWSAEMDATINTGLGSGTKTQDMAMLQAIAAKQEQILLQLGPGNPLCDLSQYRNTLAKMVEIGGLRSAEQYFKDVTPEAIQQMAASRAEDPKAAEARQKAELKMLEIQADEQAEMAKLAMQERVKLRQLEIEAGLKMRQMAIEAQLEREANVMNARMGAVMPTVRMGGEIG